MVSYDELCQALDRYNSRLRNEAELNQLGQDATGGPGRWGGSAALQVAPTEVNLTADGEPTSFDQPAAASGMAQVDIDQALGLRRDAAAISEQQALDQSPQGGELQQPVSSDDVLAASELAQERPEDTHEIDVDDVVVEDK